MSFTLDDDSLDDLTDLQSKIHFNDHDDADQEIENLEQQIDELNKYLISIKSHSQDRLRRYNRTIEKLNTRIQLAQDAFAADLEEQKAAREKEIRDLEIDHQQNKEEIIHGAQMMNRDAEKWVETAESLNQLADQMEIIDVKKSINRTRAEETEFDMTKTYQSEERKTIRLANMAHQEKYLKLLENEIERYQSLARQEDAEYQQMCAECSQAQDNREKCHFLTVSKLKSESDQREKIFATHLGVIQKKLEKEMSKNENDNNAWKETESSLLALKKTINQRSLQQLSRAARDVEQTEKLLKNDSENDKQSQMMTTTTVLKAHDVARENEILRQKILATKNQLEAIQCDIQKGSAELTKARTPQKLPKRSIRSSFL